jgi:hypothetical protein
MRQIRKYKNITYSWKQTFENKAVLKCKYHLVPGFFSSLLWIDCKTSGPVRLWRGRRVSAYPSSFKSEPAAAHKAASGKIDFSGQGLTL